MFKTRGGMAVGFFRSLARVLGPLLAIFLLARVIHTLFWVLSQGL